jgi:hypothetical protein
MGPNWLLGIWTRDHHLKWALVFIESFSVGISYVTNLDLLHTNYNRRVNKYNGILLPALMMETIFFWIHLNEVTYFDPHVVE